jgi:hypothetical protein
VDKMMATPVMPPEQNGTSSRELKENTNFVDRPFPSKNQIFGLNFNYISNDEFYFLTDAEFSVSLSFLIESVSLILHD